MKLRLLLILVPIMALCQVGKSSNPFPGNSNYVVIGAFSIQNNAVKLTKMARKLHLEANFEMNSNRKLFYVYVLKTENKQQAIEEAVKLRSETPYSDSWVFSGPLGLNKTAQGQDLDPATQETQAEVVISDASTSTADDVTERETEEKDQAPVMANNETANTVTPSEEVESGKMPFYFKLYSASKGKELEGDIDIIDNENLKKLATYEGNKVVSVSTEVPSGLLTLQSQVFGYRKLQQQVHLNNLTGDGFEKGSNGAVVVPFELVRLRKGDIAVMYNVFFFKDAAIMRPESKYEVESLVEMMKENPKCKIKIHGHTNGGAAGKIITRAKDSRNFFSLSGTKEGFGSAKKLSGQRAEAIRDYLLSEGIEADRTEVKAWGGKRPLFDKNDPKAQSNVRVEIEILED